MLIAPEAGDYYVASPSSGVNIYYLEVAEGPPPERPAWDDVSDDVQNAYRFLIVLDPTDAFVPRELAAIAGLAASWLSQHYGAPVMLFALLLGMAFHPDYASNGRFFVHYNATGDKLGSVENLMIDKQSGTIRYAVLEVGRRLAERRLIARLDDGPLPHLLELNYGRRWNRLWQLSPIAPLVEPLVAATPGVGGGRYGVFESAIRLDEKSDWVTASCSSRARRWRSSRVAAC